MTDAPTVGHHEELLERARRYVKGRHHTDVDGASCAVCHLVVALSSAFTESLTRDEILTNAIKTHRAYIYNAGDRWPSGESGVQVTSGDIELWQHVDLEDATWTWKARAEKAEAALASVPELWECPDCGFRMAAEHVNDDGSDEHSCPNCAETRLKAALASVQAERDDAYRLLGPARMVLDLFAEGRGEYQEAADMAQRIVDIIGHPVTDEPPHAVIRAEKAEAALVAATRREEALRKAAKAVATHADRHGFINVNESPMFDLRAALATTPEPPRCTFEGEKADGIQTGQQGGMVYRCVLPEGHEGPHRHTPEPPPAPEPPMRHYWLPRTEFQALDGNGHSFCKRCGITNTDPNADGQCPGWSAAPPSSSREDDAR